MKNLIKTKDWIIISLCLTIICLGIGFSVISIQLESIKKTSDVFKVEITKVEERTPVKGGTNAPSVTSTITNNKQTVDMEFNLSTPRDEIGYRITIKNTGNIPAKIINIIENPDYINDNIAANNILPVKISHNNISGKVLLPNEETELNIIAIFEYNSMPSNMKIPYQISILTQSN